jgi:hypothetical protein
VHHARAQRALNTKKRRRGSHQVEAAHHTCLSNRHADPLCRRSCRSRARTTCERTTTTSHWARLLLYRRPSGRQSSEPVVAAPSHADYAADNETWRILNGILEHVMSYWDGGGRDGGRREVLLRVEWLGASSDTRGIETHRRCTSRCRRSADSRRIMCRCVSCPSRASANFFSCEIDCEAKEEAIQQGTFNYVLNG